VHHGRQLANELALLPTPTAWLGRRISHSTGDAERWHNPARSNELSDFMAHLRLLPTPVANDDNKSPEAHMAMKRRLPGGERTQITSLAVLARASFRQPSNGASTKPPSDAGRPSPAPRLNPSFVEWMLGAPAGWSDPGCLLSAMEFKSRSASSSAPTSSSENESG
jgi:hypothetical protein